MVFSTVWRIPSIHPPLTPRKADVGKVTSICSANLLEDDYVTWIQSIWKGVQERYSSFTLRQLMLLVSMIYYLPAFAVWYLYGSPVVIVGYQKTSHILFLFLCQFLLNFKLAAVLNLGVFLLHYKIRIPTVSCSSMNQPGPGSTKNGWNVTNRGLFVWCSSSFPPGEFISYQRNGNSARRNCGGMGTDAVVAEHKKRIYREFGSYIYISYMSTYRYRETLSKCLWWYMYWNHKWMIWSIYTNIATATTTYLKPIAW